MISVESERVTKTSTATATSLTADLDAQLLSLIQEHCPEDLSRGLLLTHMKAGGKRLRAKLCLHAAKDLSGSPTQALPFALACEILHNATLIHDDIQDGDENRRGIPSLWKSHGIARALVAGDMMLMLSIQALSSLPDPLRYELASELARVALQLGHGQMMEAELLQSANLNDLHECYHQVVQLKTAALFELPVFGAARLASQTQKDARQTAQAFAKLGVLFQKLDDLLDILGLKQRQSRGQDLWEGKVSAVVLEYLTAVPSDFAPLMAFLNSQRTEKSQPDINRWLVAIDRSGVTDVLQTRLQTEIKNSLKELQEQTALSSCAEELVRLMWTPLGHVSIGL